MRITPRTIALSIALIAAATLAGAWGFEWAGFRACELCYLQRKPYYAAIALGLATAFAPARATKAGLALLALLFLVSLGLGIYHSGVEWGAWAGPTTCTGAGGPAGSVGDMMKQLETFEVVRCDQPALRILGLSLAGWNAILSSALAALAAAGVKRA
ncbi:MAG: disulfide bond formation protein B [Rhizobiales bacterium]|nr:disulfide bond formation protein B [Hyphomicrobiales bacterium]